jgi:hypothetical protein
MARTPDPLRLADARRSGSMRRVIGVWRRMGPEERQRVTAMSSELAQALDSLDGADAEVAELSVGRGLFAPIARPGS